MIDYIDNVSSMTGFAIPSWQLFLALIFQIYIYIYIYIYINVYDAVFDVVLELPFV